MLVYRHYLVSYIQLLVKLTHLVLVPAESKYVRKTLCHSFFYLNGAVRRALTQYTSNCCLLAHCLYANSCDSTATRKTAAERKRDSGQNNSTLHQQEQTADTSRHRIQHESAEFRQHE